MHQGIGLDAFNEMPKSKAVHALYECCSSVTMAGDLADGRPYPDRATLFSKADSVLFSLSETSVDEILPAYLDRRESRPAPAAARAIRAYTDRFGFPFLMYTAGCGAESIITAIGDRLHHDVDTERQVLRNEIAKINRSRLERMLGPDGGYDNWT